MVGRATMSSFRHTAFVQLLRSHPELVPQLLQNVLGVAVPAYTTVESRDPVLDQLAPVETCADGVVELGDGKAAPKLGVITEVQLDTDPEKLETWPVYQTLLRRRLHCPVCVLVVTPFERVAAWASKPIDLGPGNEWFRVHVLGPKQFPPIVDPAAVAANPALAILTTLAHGNEAGGVPVLLETLQAVPRVDEAQQTLYFQLILEALSEPLRQALDKAMANMETPTDGKLPEMFQRLVDRGKAEGSAKTLLHILGIRRIFLSPEQRRVIEACRDEAQIQDWVERALLARTADELFG